MKTLTDTEAVIMKAIWDHEEPVQTTELIRSLNDDYGKNYARTTVTTFLDRLKGKGYIETSKKGRLSYIHPQISKEDYLTDYLIQMTEFWFDGDYELAMKKCKK